MFGVPRVILCSCVSDDGVALCVLKDICGLVRCWCDNGYCFCVRKVIMCGCCDIGLREKIFVSWREIGPPRALPTRAPVAPRARANEYNYKNWHYDTQVAVKSATILGEEVGRINSRELYDALFPAKMRVSTRSIKKTRKKNRKIISYIY